MDGVGVAPRWWHRLLRQEGRVRGLCGADTLAVLDASDDAVLGLDGSGVCLFANAAAERLFGVPVAEIVGSGAHVFVPRLAVAVRSLIDQRGAAVDTCPEARAQGRPVVGADAAEGVELTGVRQGGATFPVRVRITPAYSGRRLIAVATVHDVAAARASAAATRALLDDVHELRAVVSAVTAAVTERAIVLADAQGHITAFNRAAEKLLGYRAEDVVGRPTVSLSDPADIAAVRAELGSPPGVDPLLEITRSGLPNNQDWTFLTREGQRCPVAIRITAIGDRHDPVGFVLVAGDRTARWEPLTSSRPAADRLLLDLDDAETRTLRWQVGGSGFARRR